MAFCGRCGTQNPDENKFCSNCGAPLGIINRVLDSDQDVEDYLRNNTEIEQIDYINLESENIKERKPSRKPIKLKKRRSIPWMIVSIVALITSIVCVFLDNPTVVGIIAVVCLILGIISLVMKSKLRGFAIATIVSSSLVLVLALLNGALNTINGYSKPDQHIVFGDYEYDIPGYYENSDTGDNKSDLYVVEHGNSGAILVFLSVDIYENHPEYPSLISNNESLINQKMDMINREMDQPLEDCIMSGLNNINAKQISFISNGQMGGLKTKKYSFTSNYNEIGDAHGLCVGTFDIYTGNVYCVILMETDNSEKNYIDDFDKIIASAIFKGKGGVSTESHVNSGSNSSSEGSASPAGGVDPQLKAALDEYEAFVDEYVSFMKKYQADPNNAIGMITDYTQMLTKLASFADKVNGMDTSKMSKEDYAYYLEVLNRIEKKMLDVAY